MPFATIHIGSFCEIGESGNVSDITLHNSIQWLLPPFVRFWNGYAEHNEAALAHTVYVIAAVAHSAVLTYLLA